MHLTKDGFRSLVRYTETDTTSFERWMQLAGTPFLPTDRPALQSVHSNVEPQLGEKFAIFKRRFDEANSSSERNEEE